MVSSVDSKCRWMINTDWYWLIMINNDGYFSVDCGGDGVGLGERLCGSVAEQALDVRSSSCQILANGIRKFGLHHRNRQGPSRSHRSHPSLRQLAHGHNSHRKLYASSLLLFDMVCELWARLCHECYTSVYILLYINTFYRAVVARQQLHSFSKLNLERKKRSICLDSFGVDERVDRFESWSA